MKKRTIAVIIGIVVVALAATGISVSLLSDNNESVAELEPTTRVVAEVVEDAEPAPVADLEEPTPVEEPVEEPTPAEEPVEESTPAEEPAEESEQESQPVSEPTYYYCGTCGAPYGTQAEANACGAAHVVYYYCATCGAAYGTQAEADACNATHQAPAPNTFTCSVCGQTFTDLDEFTKCQEGHYDNPVPDGECTCPWCGQYCANNAECIKHLTEYHGVTFE